MYQKESQIFQKKGKKQYIPMVLLLLFSLFLIPSVSFADILVNGSSEIETYYEGVYNPVNTAFFGKVDTVIYNELADWYVITPIVWSNVTGLNITQIEDNYASTTDGLYVFYDYQDHYFGLLKTGSTYTFTDFPVQVVSGVTLLTPVTNSVGGNPIWIRGGYVNVGTYDTLRFSIYYEDLGFNLTGSYLDVPLVLANGSFNISKWYNLPYSGSYSIKAQLYDSNTSSSTVFSNEVYVSLISTTSSSFASSTLTLLTDKEIFKGILENATTTSFTTDSASCMPFRSNFPYFNLNFSPLGCIQYLFIPTEEQQAMLVVDLKEAIAVSFPFNVWYNMSDIFSTTTTASLDFDIPIPHDMPFAENMNYSLPIHLDHGFDLLLDATSSYATSSSIYGIGGMGSSSLVTVRSVTMYYWNIFIWFLVGIYCIYRIFNFPFVGVAFQNQKQVQFSKAEDETYRLREKLYNMSLKK